MGNRYTSKTTEFKNITEMNKYINELIEYYTINKPTKEYTHHLIKLNDNAFTLTITKCNDLRRVGVGKFDRDITENNCVNLVLSILDEYYKDLHKEYKTIELFEYITIEPDEPLYKMIETIINYSNSKISVDKFAKDYYYNRFYKKVKRGFSCSLTKIFYRNGVSCRGKVRGY